MNGPPPKNPRFIMGMALVCVLPLLSLPVGCSPLADRLSPPPDPATYAPLEASDWPVSTPAKQGLNARLVSNLFRDAAKLPNLYGLVIVKNGYLVAEGYFNGNSVTSRWPRASVAKSYTSALVGIAIAQGLLSGVDQRMVEFFPEFANQHGDPRKMDITIDDMLKMRSGYPWEEQTPPHLGMLLSSNDWLPFLVDFPLTSDPGTRFGYSNLTAHALSAVDCYRSD
jgi:CubicO group peptidase (beta-lactamase class C family)